MRETINSPTFTILKEYAGRLPLYHFDLYRIEDPAELYALGFEMYFGATASRWSSGPSGARTRTAVKLSGPRTTCGPATDNGASRGACWNARGRSARAALLADFAYAVAEHGTQEGEANA